MRKFFKRLRKGLQVTCISVTMITCWSAGQSAQAAISPQKSSASNQKMIHFSGLVAPTENDISHLYLLYGTAGSGSLDYGPYIVYLGETFAEDEVTSYSAYTEEIPSNYHNYSKAWMVVGLYGDISSDQYDGLGHTNGVTVSLNSSYADTSWSHIFGLPDEETIFDSILNGETESLLAWAASVGKWASMSVDVDYNNMYDFSTAAYNGEIEIHADIVFVPEPLTVFLVGAGGVIAWRRKRGD